MFTYLAIIAFTLYAYWKIVKPFKHPPNFPPGPRNTNPILGDALTLLPNNLVSFAKLHKKYGHIFGGWLTYKTRFVAVDNYDLILEAGTKDELISRPFVEALDEQKGSLKPSDPAYTPGVLFSRGQHWRDMRRFSLTTLRDLGLGKNSTEDTVVDEAIDLCKRIEAEKEKPLNIRNDFNISVLNTLWRMISGERLSPDSQKIQHLIRIVDQLLSRSGKPSFALLSTVTWLARLVIKFFPSWGWGSCFGELTDLCRDIIKERHNNLSEDAQHTYMEHHLQEMKRHNDLAAAGSEEASHSFIGERGESNMMALVTDFFFAGADTTSTTLNWSMLFMLLNQDIQKKVHEELDAVAGLGHAPSFSKRNSTPYVEAVLHEVQRLGNILPNAVHHATMVDTTMGGYTIPAHTIIFCNLGNMMKDPEFFPDPLKFDPSRYLTEDGTFKPHQRVLPFGVGRRRCLGESLARMSLYTFFTNVMARFRIEPEDPNNLPTTEPKVGIVCSPQPYKIRFIPRH